MTMTFRLPWLPNDLEFQRTLTFRLRWLSLKLYMCCFSLKSFIYMCSRALQAHLPLLFTWTSWKCFTRRRRNSSTVTFPEHKNRCKPRHYFVFIASVLSNVSLHIRIMTSDIYDLSDKAMWGVHVTLSLVQGHGHNYRSKVICSLDDIMCSCIMSVTNRVCYRRLMEYSQSV